MTQAGVVAAHGECRNLRIGGRTPADRNVIAGNDSAQIYLLDTVGTRVQGNYLGVNAAGTAAVVPGGAHGIVVENSDGLVTIGGGRSGEGNVVSGNVYGVVIAGGEFVVAGNRIGTNAAGTAAIPNERGITVFFGEPVTIGGTTAGARNLISGNSVGVDLNGASNELVQGNWIGTDAQGKAAVPNDVGIFLGGIFSQPGDDNLVGGTAPGAGNVISGNRVGIRIENGNHHVIIGNRIGTRPDGKRPLPNTENGIEIVNSGGKTSTGNRVGGIVPGAGNVIAFNGGAGVAIGGDADTSQNSVRGNVIRVNGGLGIDLQPAGPGVTPNDDDDPDTGPNTLQNFPGISSAQSGPGGTTIVGTLESTPSAGFVVDLYAVDAADPSGHGEGAVYLGDVGVGTDAGGGGIFSVTFPKVLGNFVTATATSGSGNTSEFSVAQEIVGPGGFRLSSATYSVAEGAGHATISVKRIGGSEGAVTVRYATANGSAKAPADYAARTGTLHFAAGQITRSFSVPIVNDAGHEPAERFSVRIFDPAGGAALGSPTTAKVTIKASD
jgi:titin